MSRKQSHGRCLTALLVTALTLSPVSAKDIKLGGEKKDKIPITMIALPTIAVMIRTEDGGWKHIKIDAWLAGTDVENAQALERLKHTIITRADHELPNRNYEVLQSPGRGSAEAKRVIHAAVEAGLGHEWNGDVLIHNMMVY